MHMQWGGEVERFYSKPRVANLGWWASDTINGQVASPLPKSFLMMEYRTPCKPAYKPGGCAGVSQSIVIELFDVLF